MSLLEELKSVRDRRTQPRYPQWVILVLVIMGTMSQCYGYRSLSRFVSRHQAALLELLELPHERLPCRSTLRNVMIHLDYEALTEAFNRWAIHSGALSESGDSEKLTHLATDGKAVKASVKDYSQSYQDFVSLVSMFNVATGQVVALAPRHDNQTSEVAVVRQLLEQLQLTEVCISLDALHTKKQLS